MVTIHIESTIPIVFLYIKSSNADEDVPPSKTELNPIRFRSVFNIL